MTVGQRLKRLRLEKGLTQEELGKILGITKGAVQKYESGQIKNFKSDSVKRLTEFFEVPPIYFIFDDVPDLAPKDLRKTFEAHFGKWVSSFIENANKLNEDGLRKLMEYCEDIASIDKYRKGRDKK